MNLNDRNTLILVVLIILVVLVGFYFLLLSPLRGEFAGLVDKRGGKEAELQKLQQQVKELKAIADNSPDIERQLLELSKRIPTQPEVPSFVVQVEEISGAAGVTQLSVEPGEAAPPESGGDFSGIPITMTFEGTYEQLQDFMVRLQNLARLVAVTDVSYKSAKQEGGGTTTLDSGIERPLRVEIVAEIFFQPGDVSSVQAPVAPDPAEVTTPQGGATSAQ